MFVGSESVAILLIPCCFKGHACFRPVRKHLTAHPCFFVGKLTEMSSCRLKVFTY